MHPNQQVGDGKARLLEALRKKNVTGLFYLYGANEHAKAVLVKRIREEAPDPATRHLNFVELDARQLKTETLAKEWRKPPHLSQRRVVVVANTRDLNRRAVNIFRHRPIHAVDTLMVIVAASHARRDEWLAGVEGIVLAECNR